MAGGSGLKSAQRLVPGGSFATLPPVFCNVVRGGYVAGFFQWMLRNPLPLCPSVFGSYPEIPGPAVTQRKKRGGRERPPIAGACWSWVVAPAVPPHPPPGDRSRPIYPCGKARIRTRKGGGKRRGRRGPLEPKPARGADRERAPAGPKIGAGCDLESSRRIAQWDGGISS